MNSSPFQSPSTPEFVAFDETTMHVVLRNGDRVSAPLMRFPRLLRGTAEQRQDWRVIGAGDGIHWPQLDEDINIRGLVAEKSEKESGTPDIPAILSMIGDVYASSFELRRRSGRRFILDGLFVATTGQVVAEYIYGLKPQTDKDPYLRTQDGKSVKVALTGPTGTGFAIRWTESAKKAHADLLLCLQLTEQGFSEIYNGEFPVELLRERKVSSSGQIQLSSTSLSELNPALLDKVHSLASINRLLNPKFAHAA